MLVIKLEPFVENGRPNLITFDISNNAVNNIRVSIGSINIKVQLITLFAQAVLI